MYGRDGYVLQGRVGMDSRSTTLRTQAGRVMLSRIGNLGWYQPYTTLDA